MSNIDNTILKRFISDVGSENAIMIIDIFCEEINEYKKELTNDNSLSKIKELMHKLKSSSLSLGAAKLAEIAIEIENSARNGNERTHERLGELFESFNDTLKFYSDYRKVLEKE